MESTSHNTSPAPIIRVCRKRGADPHSALVLQFKRHKADPLLFTLFKTASAPEYSEEKEGHKNTVIDFRSSANAVAETQSNEEAAPLGNPLAFANEVVGEVGGPEPNIRPTNNEVVTVNGRPMVPVDADMSPDLVFDFYKISRGVICQTVADEDFDMRFATKEEELLLCQNDNSESDGCRDDDDDSNDEDNWRNDYPDEELDSDDSKSGRESLDGYVNRDLSDDDGLHLRMQRFGLEDEEYGSSDDSDYD